MRRKRTSVQGCEITKMLFWTINSLINLANSCFGHFGRGHCPVNTSRADTVRKSRHRTSCSVWGKQCSVQVGKFDDCQFGVTVVDGVPTFKLPASVELRHSERDDFLCLMRPSGTAPVAPTGSLVLQFQQCNLVALSRDDCIKALLIDHDARCSDVRDEECRSWA